ncbi:MAG: ABC transporter ATP-binding protein [Chloroflexi bacterium]|nr:ABC transporter ATP-binding protein [Chloroflexota bacterium]
MILEVTDLRKEFGGLMAVFDVSFRVASEEILAIIGPNGAGKTTTFNLLSGVLSPSKGEIRFGGWQLNGMRPYAIARIGLTRTFQNVQLFGNMTVLENVMVGLHGHLRYGLLGAAFRPPGVRREERQVRVQAMDALDRVGLADRAGESAANLPFGQQRLLEIARALATAPKLLMLDEPGSGLNRPEKEELGDLIRAIRADGVTVLLVEHDMPLVMGIADRIVVLEYGQKIAEGTPAEIQANQRVIDAYLGEVQ